MTRHHGRLLAVEANHGLLVEIDTTAAGHDRTRREDVSLVADLYKTFGDNTYTSLATRGHDIYLGTYGRFDNNFAGGIYKLSPRGHVQVASGLTSVIAIAFDREKRLYALPAPIFDGGGAGLGRLTRTNDASFAFFNPFTETPVRGTHYQFGPLYGQPTGVGDYQAPREFNFSVGVRF